MASDKIQKTLVLKRCYMPSGLNSSLENVINDIQNNLPKHMDRTYQPELFRSYLIASIDKSNKKGLFVSIYCKDDGATGLINFEKSQEKAEVEEYHAPQNRAWLNNEILLYVVDNHVIACNMGAKDKFLGTMLADIAQKAKAVNDDFQFYISDVPNKTTIDKINSIGVKNVDLALSGYLATFPNMVSLNSSGVRRGFSSVVESLFGMPDSSAENIKKRSETTGRILLSRGRFKKDEFRKDEWLTNIGRMIVEENLEDYKITLEDDSVISTSKLRVVKAVQLNRHANSFSQAQACKELETYYEELKKNGSLDW